MRCARVKESCVICVSEKIKQGGNTKIAFNSGIKQIHQKNAKKDLLLYGQEFKGNMA